MANRRPFLSRYLALLVLGSVLGCATDGGVGGTGITGSLSEINGNVAGDAAASSALAAARAQSDYSGVRVRLREYPTIEDVTDSTGYFLLRGDFAGDVTVEFEEPDAIVSSLDVYVPAGGELILTDVRVNRLTLQAQPDRITVDFEAVVLADALCTGDSGTVEVMDRSPAANRFVVLVGSDTRYEDDERPTVTPTCDDLLERRTLRIRGVEADGVITATRVRLERSRPTGRGGQAGSPTP